MILRKAFFIIVSVSSLAWANMRAPVQVGRNGGELKAEGSVGLTVLGESLDFRCPESYKGKPDFTAFAERACDAKVRYRVSAQVAAKVKLSFIYSGSNEVRWHVGGKSYTSTAETVKVTGSSVCTFCPDSMKVFLSATQSVDLAAGENAIEIAYKQALNYSESSHSYFSDGKWSQGITYELWPIAEWKWAETFSAELRFSVAARSGFLGVGYKDDRIECMIEGKEKQQPVRLEFAKVHDGLRIAMARLQFKKGPQRLRCWYSAE